MKKLEDARPAAGELESVALPEDLRAGEYYFEGPYMVFTAAYHLRRGSCCHSGCRHCPYGEGEG